MEIPKLILICPLLLYLEAFSLTSPTDDVFGTCTQLCQGQKVIDHCEGLLRHYDKGTVVDQANVMFLCCLGYGLNGTGIPYKSYEVKEPELEKMADIMMEVHDRYMAYKYATCIRDCSSGALKTLKVDEVKSCRYGSQNCPTYKCPA
ncbi:uncharacterized protein LOC124256041 [Haliotis rubra]|uniref:uncharacterized protein LOC124256041 n=1 Tax=Haliotis rubra TaxID=36100 RepID=UPI001EE4FA28|nr:uncharacterized protein LOC124256041 [Haliotis rubra]